VPSWGGVVRIELTRDEREKLEAAAGRERRARDWRRYRAILLLATRDAEDVAADLGCSRASVYRWAERYREHGPTGLVERRREGRPARLAGAGEAALTALLAEDPQQRGRHAIGWTVSMLQDELAAVGHAVGARTIRRTLHRLGWRWKRPKYVFGRPDPGYDEKRHLSVSRVGKPRYARGAGAALGAVRSGVRRSRTSCRYTTSESRRLRHRSASSLECPSARLRR
jgi:transposase